MKKLIALLPILYLSKQYAPGEEIPASDPAMVEAWLENNAAFWEGESVNAEVGDYEEENYEEDSDEDEFADIKEGESFKDENEVATSQQQGKDTPDQGPDESLTNEKNKESEKSDTKPITGRNRK